MDYFCMSFAVKREIRQMTMWVQVLNHQGELMQAIQNFAG